ncbi:MAG: DUF924 domain-containing protein [Gammaproteobacteria bacterium]|nr:DUF924 domain-containing protein [Gammaproteobacteria bacterium]
MPDITPDVVIDFWIGAAATDREAAREQSQLWYHADAALDRNIEKRFGAAIELAGSGQLTDWEASPDGALAIVLLLDQFSRNANRGTAQAFAHDRAALEVAKRAIDAGYDRQVSVPGRAFMYHPFEHSESLTEQHRSIVLFEAFAADVDPLWRDFAESFLGYARGHREVVARYGRFPHRNVALKRANSADEHEYLKKGGNFGQDAP